MWGFGSRKFPEERVLLRCRKQWDTEKQKRNGTLRIVKDSQVMVLPACLLTMITMRDSQFMVLAVCLQSSACWKCPLLLTFGLIMLNMVLGLRVRDLRLTSLLSEPFLDMFSPHPHRNPPPSWGIRNSSLMHGLPKFGVHILGSHK